MKILVCGPGCAKCDETEQLVKNVVTEMNIDADIEKVTDFNAIAQLGIFTTPAVVVDGTVKCIGKVPKKNEVMKWVSS